MLKQLGRDALCLLQRFMDKSVGAWESEENGLQKLVILTCFALKQCRSHIATVGDNVRLMDIAQNQ